jgi:hypothetical protein
MYTLGKAYGLEIDKERMAVYFQALSGQSIEAVSYACEEVVKCETKFPTPATIRQYTSAYRKPTIRITYDPPATDFGRECCSLIQDLLSEKINRTEYWMKAGEIAEKYNKADMLDTACKRLQEAE